MVGEHLPLPGCAPTPLASYLKALGILRLISSPASHRTGCAADPNARGWWENECFHLQTTLDRDSLRRFFLRDYAPTPIIAPWNGRSGFYPTDHKAGFEPLAHERVSPRFSHLSAAIRRGVVILKSLGLTEKPSGTAKAELVARLRAELPDPAIPWVDSVVALSGEKLAFPELLGTGGNDGNFNFTNHFLFRLVSRDKGKPPGLFDAQTGEPSNEASPLLADAMFSTQVPAHHQAPAGQFAPAADGWVNPWDFVFTLEGATAFAGAATRRHQGSAGVPGGAATTRSGASFPFTVRTVGAGWGGVEISDENDSRAEFWAPLWDRPARYSEIVALLGEGRAVLDGRTAKDGLEFARAAASLGVSRGCQAFERFVFLMRSGKMYIAAPIGRRAAAPSDGASLVADLDAGGWLDSVRRFGRAKESPEAARRATRQIEDALFDLVSTSGSPVDRAPVQRALVAVGQLSRWLAVSPSGREIVRTPPPPLRSAWLPAADDKSAEFRIAAAIAGIGLPPPADLRRADGIALSGDGGRPGADAQPSPTHPPPTIAGGAPPMAAHLAPLAENAFLRAGRLHAHRAWSDDSAPPTVVWGAGSLTSNLIAVLERRLVEASIHGLADKPLAASTFAQLSDIAAFIAGDFDDARCAGLLAGLVWARPARLPPKDRSPASAPLPFPYAALKPLFSPDARLHFVGALPTGTRLPIPPGLLAHLRAGGSARDGRATNIAVTTALARARASGLASPFGDPRSQRSARREGRIGAGVRADRLAAALLIPVSDRGLASLIERAFPGALPPQPENSPRST